MMLILSDKRKSHMASLNKGSNGANNSCKACVLYMFIVINDA